MNEKLQTKNAGEARMLTSLLDAVAAPVFMLHQGHIQYANPAALRLSGLNGEEIVDEGFHTLMQAADAAVLAGVAEGKRCEGRCLFRGAGGIEIPLLLSAEKVEAGWFADDDAGGGSLLVTLKEPPASAPVPEPEPQHWQRIQAENERQQDLLQTIFEVDSGGLAVLAGPDRVVQSANRAFRATLPDPHMDPSGKPLSEVWPGEEGRHLLALVEQVLETGEAMHQETYQQVRVDGSHNYFSLHVHPLHWGHTPAVLVFAWDKTDLERAQHQARQSIVTAQRRADEVESLMRVASVLRLAISQEEMFQPILGSVVQLLNVEGASLLMPDSGTGDIVVRLAKGEWTHTQGQRIPAGQGITSYVMAEGKPFVSNDIQKDPRLNTSVFARGLKCGACVALSSHGQIIGAIWVGSNTPIEEDTMRLMAVVADIAASNLFRARLFDQTQLRLQRLSGLHSIDMAITSSLDLNLTLGVLLDQVVSQMQVHAADILLFDSALYWLEFASGRGFLHPESRYGVQRLGDTPAGQVATDRKTLSIPNLAQSELANSEWVSQEEGFRAYFAAPLIAKGQVKGVLELFHREAYFPDREWLEFLETLSTQAAIAIDSAELFERLQRSNEELRMAYDATIEGWSRALELRNQETYGHAQRVTEITTYLARRIGVPDEEIQHYRRGVLLHDIGKMAIPDAILLKDGPLTAEEQENMRMHPVYAYDLLHPIPYLRPALDIPYAHHEWWDGSGYPRGLKGDEIPLSARIFAVVDVWDALRSDRSYRPAWPAHKVIEHIRSLSGKHFDPSVVEEFIKMLQSTDVTRRPRASFL